MKIMAVVVIVMAAGFSGRAMAGEKFQRTVTVYMVDEHLATGPAAFAKDQGAKMFAQIGIKIQWRSVGRSLPPDALVVEMLQQASPQQCAGALACAKPFEGVHIYLFYDRIRAAVPNYMVSPLLAHVLVHEITHILQGVSRHSDTGVMKARWDDKDFELMARKSLQFGPEDVLLIKRGLEAHESRPVAAEAARSAVRSLRDGCVAPCEKLPAY